MQAPARTPEDLLAAVCHDSVDVFGKQMGDISVEYGIIHPEDVTRLCFAAMAGIALALLASNAVLRILTPEDRAALLDKLYAEARASAILADVVETTAKIDDEMFHHA